MAQPTSSSTAADTIVLAGAPSGHTVIPAPTVLTRLNYYDGKYLRAADLSLEQQYLRGLVALGNQAGGAGVVHGFDLVLRTGDSLALGPGLAIDGRGRVLLLPDGITVSVAALIEASRRHTARAQPRRAALGRFDDCEVVSEVPPADTPRGSDLYLITIGHAEALCGQEDVYGKLCEEACVTSTDRPYRIEGLVVRATPLALTTPLATSRVVALDRRHLRSLVASAYFADEALRVGQLISRAGLALDSWCLGADAGPASDVPVGVLARAGDTTVFLDAWTARRERIEPPPRRYWAWRMRMRPWDVHLAQILQFQCQLRGVLGRAPEPGGEDDPCAEQHQALSRASRYLGEVAELVARREAPAAPAPELLPGGVQRIVQLNREVFTALQKIGGAARDRILINGGIVELPSAGYLPVVPGSSITVNTQVRRLLGEGLDLRFCVVRPDFVAHALEEAQHMDRISLLRGLDDARAREQVDVLVPDGEIVPSAAPAGLGFEVALAITAPIGGKEEEMRREPPEGMHLDEAIAPERLVSRIAQPVLVPRFDGAGRAEVLGSGGAAFHFAGAAQQVQQLFLQLVAGAFEDENRDTGALREAIRNVESYSAGLMNRLPLAELVAVTTQADTSVAAWLTLRCEQDLFALAPGATTNISADAVLATAVPALRLGTRLVAIEVNLTGPLYVRSVARPGNTRVVTGLLRRARASLTPLLNGAARRIETALVSVDIEVTLTLAAGGESKLELTVHGRDDLELNARATVAWSGTPTLATVVLSGIDDDGNLEEGARARLRHNDDVFRPDHPLHTLALGALDIVERGLGQPGFRASAQAMLFPGVAAEETLVVRATRDWVLFHRRRDKRCTPVAERFAPTRSYQLYHVEADTRDRLAALVATLRRGGSIEEFEPARVGLAEFAPESPALLSPADALRDAWRSLSPGNVLPYGAVASEPAAAAEGADLARARLRTAATTFEPVSAIPADAQFDLLPDAPAGTGAAGLDGVMLFATLSQEVVETCHDALRATRADWETFLRAFHAGDIATAVNTLNALAQQSRLGTVQFERGITNFVGTGADEVAAKWNEGVGTPPAHVAVLLLPQHTPDEAHAEQAHAIGSLLGNEMEPQVVDIRSVTMPLVGFECPMATVLVVPEPEPQTRLGRAVLFFEAQPGPFELLGANPEWTVEFQPDGTFAKPFTTETIDELRRTTRQRDLLITRVSLAPRGALDATANARLEAVVRALADARLLARGADGNPQIIARVISATDVRPELDFFDRDGIRADDLLVLGIVVIG